MNLLSAVQISRNRIIVASDVGIMVLLLAENHGSYIIDRYLASEPHVCYVKWHLHPFFSLFHD